MKDFEEINLCDLCGSKNTKIFLLTEDRNYQTGKFTYIKCENCGLVWLSLRPRQNVLSKYYPKIYKAHLNTKQPSIFKKKVRSLIYSNVFLSKLLIKDQLFFWKNKGKILDVGTGNGAYLEVLKGWGWDSYGLEISKETVINAKKSGIQNIEQGVLLTSKFPNEYFDAVRFSHVMEHVPSPKKELDKTNKLLKKNGKVIILIPNINSLFFYLFRSYWYPLDPPRHFYHFTPESIKSYLYQTGYRNIQIRHTQSVYTFIRSFQYLMGRKRVEKRYGILIYPLSFLMKFIDLLKLSDVIEVVATKK